MELDLRGVVKTMSTESAGYKSEYTQEEQLERWSELIAYFRWYP